VVNALALHSALRSALDRSEFVLQYQPILDLGTGAVRSVEALVRWARPGHGMVPPGEFIPVAEENGLIVEIGRWVLREACRQARTWQIDYPMDPPLSVSVNVSTRQLVERNLVADIAATLEETSFRPGDLVLEITETGLLSDLDQIGDTLRQVKRLGVRLAIDDFGTGSSSLVHVRRFPVDILKVDRTFVETIAGNTDADQAFVRTIVDLAAKLRLETVAEGIETADQLDRLRQIGCRFGQGFHFARPLDPPALVRYLEESRQAHARPALHRAS
jgi:EAL domain-containing protein (putative c-di-GMP-specific phosphodiesterase class I)